MIELTIYDWRVTETQTNNKNKFADHNKINKNLFILKVWIKIYNYNFLRCTSNNSSNWIIKNLRYQNGLK